MVQEFHVLRCFSCQSFQVQQVKKVSRWSCKLCGEKQSLLKEFGRGSGADCRRHVQKLNAMRGALLEDGTGSLWKQVEADEEAEEQDQGVQTVGVQTVGVQALGVQTQGVQTQGVQTQGVQALGVQTLGVQTVGVQTPVSRWSKYLDPPEEAEPEEEEAVFMDRQHLHDNSMIDRKRKRREEGPDSCSPGQADWTRAPSLTQTRAPSLTQTRAPGLTQTRAPGLTQTRAPSLTQTRAPSLTQTRAPSLTQTTAPSLTQTRAPSLTQTRAPSLTQTRAPGLTQTRAPGPGPVSTWTHFLSSACQEEAEPSLGGRSRSCDDIICLDKPRPRLPVSSMFESGEEFVFEEF